MAEPPARGQKGTPHRPSLARADGLPLSVGRQRLARPSGEFGHYSADQGPLREIE